MKPTIEQVEAAGLRKDLKVIIGGGQMDDTVRRYTVADVCGAHGPDGGFILGSGCEVPITAKVENVAALISAARRAIPATSRRRQRQDRSRE